MKWSIFLVVLALLLGFSPAVAQDQAGAVAIAATIRSKSGEVMELGSFTDCVAKMMSVGASYKEAAKDCREYRKVLADESKKIANEAADATKASRPVVVDGWGRNGYGYGYRSYGYNNSYPRRTVVVRQVAPRRSAPPQRQASPPRERPRR